MMQQILRHLDRLRRDESGAALVEFAITLPLLLLLFASIVEGTRMLWAYQSATSGVRDAARYLARIAPRDICATGGGVGSYATQLQGIVQNGANGQSLFPTGMTVNSVTPTLTCIAGTWRKGDAPIVDVAASVTITMPFGGVFGLVGAPLPTVNATVRDQSRVYGS